MSRWDYTSATHCRRGHVLTNYRDTRGSRICLVCRRLRDRDRKRKLAAARRAQKSSADER